MAFIPGSSRLLLVMSVGMMAGCSLYFGDQQGPADAAQDVGDAGGVMDALRGDAQPPPDALTWTPDPGYIKASNPDPLDQFGWSIALSADGTTLAIGAILESSDATGVGGDQADNSAVQSGAVYIYTRSGGAWSQQAYLKASNTVEHAWFGTSLALSSDGSTLVVGAQGEPSGATGINQPIPHDTSESDSGAAYVFVRSGTTWSQQAYIKASRARPVFEFGASVALSSDGSTLAVGAYGEESAATGIDGDQDDFSMIDAGAAYVFTRAGTTWTQQAYVKASNTDYDDAFGSSVSLSGDGSLLAVGAPGESSLATGLDGVQTQAHVDGIGAVYVFARTGMQWAQQSYIKPSNSRAGEGFCFGNSVAVSTDSSTLAVGAKCEASASAAGDQTDTSAASAGAVYVFARAATSWTQQAYLKATNAGAGDEFGCALALSNSGSSLVVGALAESSGASADPNDNSVLNAGAAYTYARTGTQWSALAFLKAPNAAAHDTDGRSVALSGDGTTVAISASGESSAAKGIGGDMFDQSCEASGAAYVTP